MTAGRPVIRRTSGAAALVASIIVVSGCGLLIDLDPPNGTIYECFVTLRAADGEEIEVASLATPEFLSWDYFICTGGPCPTGCDRDEEADFLPDWESLVARRLDEISSISDPSDPLYGSDFRTRAGPWCRVPGSLRCEPRGPITTGVACPPSLPAASVPECAGAPPPPGGEPCISVECGASPCREIFFGDVPTGERAGSTVTVRNCGEAPLRVQIDETVISVPPRSEFTIPDAANGCRARDPGEERLGRLLEPFSIAPDQSSCSFDVHFAPTEPLEHRGLIRFASDADPRHEIQLAGNAVGGTLEVDAPETTCLATSSDPCTITRTIRITNRGPGAVAITGVRIEPTPGTGFEIVAPPPPTLPATLGRDASLDVRLRWCGPMSADVAAALVVESTAVVDPTVVVPITVTTGTCPPRS